MQPETSSKPVKPLAAEQPASADQAAVAVRPQVNASHPSASPAPVANTPAAAPRASVRQEQPEKPPKPKTTDEALKEAALHKAEILSILYKHGAMIVRGEQEKKAALRAVIRSYGISKVASTLFIIS